MENEEIFGIPEEDKEEGTFVNSAEKYYPTPSRFVEFALYMPVDGEMQKFSFAGRRYLRTIYDTSSTRKVLICGRQTEKSTMLGNTILAYCVLNPTFKVLYVSPSHQQTKVFSRDRLNEPITISPIMQTFINSKLVSNVLERRFVNRSQISLRFAFLNADRCRGLSADLICIDEFQDILLDNIPVIEECSSHSSWKIYNYSGTPKSLDNALEYYWSRYSTQNEWAVPCRAHGTPNNPSSWHWNILSEDNIGPHGNICDKCGKDINPADPDCRWVSLNPKPNIPDPFEGYRISQLMVPWINWNDILNKQKTYSRAKFYNEVLGRSYDSGTRPLTRQDMVDNCNQQLSMRSYEQVAEKYSSGIPIFMGVDWGTSEGSYTVVSLGGYMPWDSDKFTYFYMHRFSGLESEPRFQIEFISNLVRKFSVQVIGVDYGGGHWPNDELVRYFGSEKVKKYQWVGNPKKKMKYEVGFGIPRWLCHRTEVMSDFFNAIKRRDVFRFPNWEEFEDPFAMDFLNVFSEYNDRLRMNVYKHAPGCPDDSAHSSIYCFLASFFYRKRPDVVLPVREIERNAYEAEEDSAERDEMDIT